MQESTPSTAELHVRDIMTTRVLTVGMDDSIMAAKNLFDRERFHHAVVIDRKQVVGVLSDRDILKAISPFVNSEWMERPQDHATLRRRVHQIMVRDPVTIGPDETAASAARLMLAERVSCLPVVDEGRSLLGIVTIRDFAAWAAKALPERPSGDDTG